MVGSLGSNLHPTWAYTARTATLLALGLTPTPQSEKYSQRGQTLEDCPAKLTLGTQ